MANIPRGVQGDLLFNDSALVSHPGTRKSVQELKVDTGGFLTFREAGASSGTSIYLPFAGTSSITIAYDRYHTPSFGVVPWDTYFAGYYPDSVLNPARFMKPELSPALADAPDSSGHTAVVQLRGHFPRGLKGSIYFNAEPILRIPITVPQKAWIFFRQTSLTTKEHLTQDHDRANSLRYQTQKTPTIVGRPVTRLDTFHIIS